MSGAMFFLQDISCRCGAHELEKRVKGSILMDLSYFVKEEDMEKLVELAHDKEEWNIIVNTIKTTQALDVIDF